MWCVMNKSVMNMVCYEQDYYECVLLWVVYYEQACFEQTPNFICLTITLNIIYAWPCWLKDWGI